jgi:chorismate synthase
MSYGIADRLWVLPESTTDVRPGHAKPAQSIDYDHVSFRKYGRMVVRSSCLRSVSGSISIVIALGPDLEMLWIDAVSIAA